MVVPVPFSAIFTWITVVLCLTWVRWWVMMVLSTWHIPPRLSVQYCWKTFERSQLTKREKPIFSPHRWSRTAWKKWCRWTFTKLYRCSMCVCVSLVNNLVYTCCLSVLKLSVLNWIIVFSFSGLSQVDDELEIKAYYAGHVLGAAMVQIKVGLESVVYTVSVNKSVQ